MFHNLSKKLVLLFLSLNLVATSFLLLPTQTFATAGLLDTASVQMSDSRPSQSGVTYTALFNIGTTTSIKCINVVFATNADMTGGVPSALVTTSAVKGTLSGTGVTNSNWSLYNATSGTLQFENSTGESHTAAQTITAPATTITNASLTTFYAQITTYSTLTTHTCSGQVDQSNVIAMTTIPGVTASVTVQPTVSFSVANYASAVNGGGVPTVTSTATTIPFGTVSAGSTSIGAHLLTVSTNAAHGYTAYVRYSGQLTDSNSDTISDTAGSNASPTTYTANTLGYTEDGAGETQFTSNTWAALTTTNAAVATRSTAQNGDTFHIEYKVQVSNTQPPGTYSNTVIYTVAPSY